MSDLGKVSYSVLAFHLFSTSDAPSTNLSYFVQACPVSSSVVPCHCISPSNAYIHSTQWVKYNQEIQMNSQSLGDTKSGTLLSRYTSHQPASAFQALYTFKQVGRHVVHLVHLHVGHLVYLHIGHLVQLRVRQFSIFFKFSFLPLWKKI